MKKLSRTLFYVAVAIMLGLHGIAPASAGETATITGIAGDHVELDNGDTYELNPGVPGGWSEGDTVIVPDDGDKLINQSDGEEVDATQD